MAAPRLGQMIGAGIAGAGASQIAASPTFSQLVATWMPAAVDALRSVAPPAAVAVAATATDMQTAALTASVRAIEAMLQQQRTASSRGATLLLAGCAAAYVAVRYLGWDTFGWATPAELQEGLGRVREAVSAAAGELKDAMALRFTRVDAQLVAVDEGVRATKEGLTAEVHAVGASVESLEERLTPIERDCRNTALGVGLLCEVVSGLATNASPDLLRRLDTFSGPEGAREARAARERDRQQLATTARALSSSEPAQRTAPLPELLPPAGRPEFLQSILRAQ